VGFFFILAVLLRCGKQAAVCFRLDPRMKILVPGRLQDVLSGPEIVH